MTSRSDDNTYYLLICNHHHRLSRWFVFRPIRALFLCWSLKTHRKVRQPQHQLLTKRFCCIWQACYKDHTCHEYCRYFLSLFYHCLPPFFFRCYPNYYMLCKLCFLRILNVLNDSKWIKKEADVFACLLKSFFRIHTAVESYRFLADNPLLL